MQQIPTGNRFRNATHPTLDNGSSSSSSGISGISGTGLNRDAAGGL